MKKTLLLAGVACLFSFGANAADYSLSELRPYVGLDYVYTDANIKKETRIKTDYNSGAINAGIRFYDYLGLEAFFQQSGERKSMKGTLDQTKSEFYAYGLDLYGYAHRLRRFQSRRLSGYRQLQRQTEIPRPSGQRRQAETRLSCRCRYSV